MAEYCTARERATSAEAHGGRSIGNIGTVESTLTHTDLKRGRALTMNRSEPEVKLTAAVSGILQSATDC